MKFSKGDVVALVDDVLRGRVVKVDQSKVFVRLDDGMECVFFDNELVKVPVEQNELLTHKNISNSFLAQKKETQVKKKSIFTKQRNEVVMEVDLHIEKLVKSARGLDNYDILNIQIDVAKRKVEYCVSKKISKIVFIHGVGEGVLKSELHYLLNNYPVKYFDASYQKYGKGATEVYVYQN